MLKNTAWHRIIFSRNEYESGELAVLFGAFRAAYVAGNGPKGMAMYGVWAEDGASYLVYTSPSSARYISPLLHAYSAFQTDIPDISALSFLYGDDSGLSASEIGFQA